MQYNVWSDAYHGSSYDENGHIVHLPTGSGLYYPPTESSSTSYDPLYQYGEIGDAAQQCLHQPSPLQYLQPYSPQYDEQYRYQPHAAYSPQYLSPMSTPPAFPIEEEGFYGYSQYSSPESVISPPMPATPQLPTCDFTFSCASPYSTLPLPDPSHEYEMSALPLFDGASIPRNGDYSAIVYGEVDAKGKRKRDFDSAPSAPSSSDMENCEEAEERAEIEEQADERPPPKKRGKRSKVPPIRERVQCTYPDCEKTFCSKATMSRHFKSKHDPNAGSDWACACGKRYTRKYRRNDHVRKYKGPPSAGELPCGFLEGDPDAMQPQFEQPRRRDEISVTQYDAEHFQEKARLNDEKEAAKLRQEASESNKRTKQGS